MGKFDRGLSTALESHAELLVRTISNTIYLDPPQNPRRPAQFHQLFRGMNAESPEQREARMSRRLSGRDWPVFAHSMAGYERLRNLANCVLDVFENEVEGHFIETGVWRGGACILMQGLCRAAGEADRKVFVADSFEGLPPPNAEEFPADEGDKHHTKDALAISLETVQDNFRSYGLLDDNVVFMKGWFKDTLPTLGDEKFGIIRLDGDMYESTIQAIEILYPKLSVGGYIIVDDFGAVRACRKAIGDYRKAHGIEEPIEQVDWTGAYWKKTRDI